MKKPGEEFADPSPGHRAGSPSASAFLAPASVVPSPPAIPDHLLLRHIGGGSYGEVWLARNVLGQFRAVKIVHRARFEDERPFEREFEGIRCFEPISRSHPSQLNILHVGRGEGCFYYVMELADDAHEVPALAGSASQSSSVAESPNAPPAEAGTPYLPRTLKLDLKRRGRLPPAECVEIGLALATALAHLHAHGLVHRDIKPSNIIFVGGVPKLADIGLVASMDATMSFVGTSGFVPPEGPGTPQSDIYSLGKVLYEIGMGRDRMEFPKLPGDLAESADASALLELNAIIVKACHCDPRERYSSAREMADELALLQRGSSVRDERRIARRKTIGRRAAIAAACLLLAAIPAGLFWQRQSVEKQRRTKEADKFVKEGWRHVQMETKESIARAIELFNQAAEADRNHAGAYVGLEQAYFASADWNLPPKQAMSEAKRAALRAVELAPRSPQAHVSMAHVRLFYDWDWAGAEQECRQALKLKPDDLGVLNNLAWALRAVGRLPEARVAQERAYALNPTNMICVAGMLSQCYQERDYTNAVRFGRRLVELYPEYVGAYANLGVACLQQGLFDEALRSLEKARTLDDAPDMMGLHGHALAFVGKTNEARALLREMQIASRHRYVSPFFEAQIRVGLGDKAEALRCLQQALQNRSIHLVSHATAGLTSDPRFDPLRNEPEFEALIRKMGLEPRPARR